MKLINLFKRISFAALSLTLLATASCKPEEQITEATISITPTGHKVNYFAQNVEVTVSSSEDWTIEGDYAWVTPSAGSGKNGDKVTFSINANTSGKTRSASFTFKVNGAEAKLGIQQTAGDIEMELDLEAVSSGDTDVSLKLSVTSEDIAFFNNWGIIYSLTNSKDEGKEFKIENSPANGDKDVTVTGLETNKKYYFWAYVEDVDGNRIYTDRAVEKNTGNLLDIPVTYSAGAYSIYATIDFQMEDIAELGICWNETENPTIEDNTAIVANPAKGEVVLCSITSGKKLKENTKYYISAYAKDESGKISYAAPSEVTTIASPLNNWTNSDAAAENKFNSLCEYGPSWDGQSDYSQYVTASASEAQNLVRKVWDNAFLSYTSYHYSYHSLMFKEIDGKMYMYHQIYREGSPNEGVAKEANFIGGLVYSMALDSEGNMSFSFEGLQHMSTNNWVCDRQDVTKNEMYKLYNDKAGNKDEILQIQQFYTQHSFFVDYGPEIIYDNKPYRELRFYAADDYSIAFNYHQRIIGYKNYDFTTYATDDSAESEWSGEGGDDENSGLAKAPSAYADMRNNSIAITWADNASVNNLSGITMEALVNWAGNNGDGNIDTILGIEGSWLVRCMWNFHWIPEDGWFVCTPGGSVCFAPFQRTDGNVTNWGGMTTNVWHHLAITYDSNTSNASVYIDGKAIMNGNLPLGPVNLYDSSLENPTFHIGKSFDNSRWFNGEMAEIRLWNRALSADEIQADGHFYSVDPNSDGLFAYWKLDSGEGTHVQDYSGNGNHGTAASAISYSGTTGETPEPEPEVEDKLYLFVNLGGTEVKYEVPKANDSDWYYRSETGTLNGYQYRLSFNASTGYPAYIPEADGGYKEISDASGMVTMTSESSQANSCVVSFCKSENVCVVKDVFYQSNTVTVVGDAIVTSYGEDWNAWKAYSVDGNFFTPEDTMREPHVWSITATFKKKDGGEGFKLITDGGWNNCIMSDSSGADPVGNWCPATFKYENDWKWNPQVEGKYKILFDFSKMMLKMEAVQ